MNIKKNNQLSDRQTHMGGCWCRCETLRANFKAQVQTRFPCYNKREPGLDLGCEISPKCFNFIYFLLIIYLFIVLSYLAFRALARIGVAKGLLFRPAFEKRVSLAELFAFDVVVPRGLARKAPFQGTFDALDTVWEKLLSN